MFRVIFVTFVTPLNLSNTVCVDPAEPSSLHDLIDVYSELFYSLS